MGEDGNDDRENALLEGLMNEESVVHCTLLGYDALVESLAWELALGAREAMRRNCMAVKCEQDDEIEKSLASCEAVTQAPGEEPPQPQGLNLRCPLCGNKQYASRFAPHLEKCMGRGRQGARPNKQQQHIEVDLEPAPSNGSTKPNATGRRSTSTGANNSTVRRMQELRKRLATNVSLDTLRDHLWGREENKVIAEVAEEFFQLQGLLEGVDPKSKEGEVKAIMLNICGVESKRETTRGKLCANSPNCPTHTHRQREEAWSRVFEPEEQQSTLPHAESDLALSQLNRSEALAGDEDLLLEDPGGNQDTGGSFLLS